MNDLQERILSNALHRPHHDRPYLVPSPSKNNMSGNSVGIVVGFIVISILFARLAM